MHLFHAVLPQQWRQIKLNKNLCIRKAIKRNRFGARMGPNPSGSLDPPPSSLLPSDKGGIVWWVRACTEGRGGEGRGVCARVYPGRFEPGLSNCCREIYSTYTYTRIQGGRGGGEGAYTWKRGGGKGVRGPEPPPSSFLHRNRLYDITPAGGEARDIRFMRPRRAFLYPSPSSSRKLCAIRGS